MGKLSHTDKHSPVVQTGQPNPEQTKPTLDQPKKSQWLKDVERKEEEPRKTGTR